MQVCECEREKGVRERERGGEGGRDTERERPHTTFLCAPKRKVPLNLCPTSKRSKRSKTKDMVCVFFVRPQLALLFSHPFVVWLNSTHTDKQSRATTHTYTHFFFRFGCVCLLVFWLLGKNKTDADIAAEGSRGDCRPQCGWSNSSAAESPKEARPNNKTPGQYTQHKRTNLQACRKQQHLLQTSQRVQTLSTTYNSKTMHSWRPCFILSLAFSCFLSLSLSLSHIHRPCKNLIKPWKNVKKKRWKVLFLLGLDSTTALLL